MLTWLTLIVLAAAVVVQAFLPDRGATSAVLLVATAVVGSLAGLWGAGRKTFGREIDDQQHRIEEERIALAETERRRLALELHGVVGREITLITLHALRVRSTTEAEKMRGALRDIQEAVRRCRASLLQLVSEASPAPPGVDDVTDVELDPAGVVTSVAAQLGDAGVEVDVDLRAVTEETSQAWCRSFARIVEEAGTNLARHSPEGSTASFGLYQAGRTLVFEARNPVGVGRLAYSTGRGIRGMRERSLLLGGSLDAGPVGDVWVVRVAVPLRGDDRSESSSTGVRGTAS